ncbi:MAG: alpha/beta fold hydrolase [Allosphingosinicella sp.]
MAGGPAQATPFRLRLVGELALFEGDRDVPLPASRKTRALFVYLLRARAPVRRERLCELFFDLPDDPRAALRWSLTKIRHMLEPRTDLLQTEENTVSLDPAGFATDVEALEAMLEAPELPAGEELAALLEEMLDAPLAGLDLPQLDSVSAWLAAERSLIDRLRGRLFLRAAGRADLTPEQRQRFAGEAARIGVEAPEAERPPGALFDQTIHYCAAPDGPRIAYACTGDGPPLVKAANWLNHLELDWDSPIWGALLNRMSQAHMLVRYDERGNGCSDWDVEDLSFEAFVRDLETVVHHVGLERFPLIGISQGCAVSIEYACRHPERVTRLVLIGGYSAGWRVSADAQTAAEREAMITLVRTGWGQDNPAYRQMFSLTFFPDATHEELDWFNEFQRKTTSAENAVRFLETFASIDVRHCLAAVKVPTLVIHAREDQRVPIAMGVELAASIPGASLVTLDTASHLPLSREPAMERMLAAMTAFLRGG